MRYFIYLIVCLFSWPAFTAHTWAAVGDVNYISDELKVPLRSGASSGHRIIHHGLPSGTPLTILEVNEEAGFTKVRTDTGTEGWVRSQYLTKTPIARIRLAAAEKRIQSLKAKLDKERATRTSLQAAYKEAQADNTALKAQVQKLTKELAELKRVSADPIRTHARNVELTQQNAVLVSEVDELSDKVKQLEDNVQLQWLLYGGALVLIGLILGVILKSRSKKSSYSRYMA